jgi:hypothetical protein
MASAHPHIGSPVCWWSVILWHAGHREASGPACSSAEQGLSNRSLRTSMYGMHRLRASAQHFSHALIVANLQWSDQPPVRGGHPQRPLSSSRSRPGICECTRRSRSSSRASPSKAVGRTARSIRWRYSRYMSGCEGALLRNRTSVSGVVLTGPYRHSTTKLTAPLFISVPAPLRICVWQRRASGRA